LYDKLFRENCFDVEQAKLSQRQLGIYQTAMVATRTLWTSSITLVSQFQVNLANAFVWVHAVGSHPVRRRVFFKLAPPGGLSNRWSCRGLPQSVARSRLNPAAVRPVQAGYLVPVRCQNFYLIAARLLVAGAVEKGVL
jgi:hypothetical protein